MAEPGSDDDKVSQNNIVFVDTSLDTHLALMVSDCDTVSDLKSNLIILYRPNFFRILFSKFFSDIFSIFLIFFISKNKLLINIIRHSQEHRKIFFFRVNARGFVFEHQICGVAFDAFHA